MNKLTFAGIAAVAVAIGGYGFIRHTEDDNAPRDAPIPEEGNAMAAVTLPDTLSPEATMGKQAFDAVCADCHGENAAGRMGMGPPLIHKVYEPSHHGDMAFYLAAANGVRAHHWQFGDMPAQPGVTKADVSAIISYVREVQRANGIN